MEEPLRQLGEFHVPVRLHRDVATQIKITIQPEDAES
jgi:large subunit ribosomal protein L9